MAGAGAGMGGRIRARRLDLGLKQAALAEAAGISAPYLNLIEHNRRPIGGRLLLALARALKVDAQELAEGAEAGLVAALGQAAAADPDLSAASGPGGDAADLAARFPGWAQLVARQHGRIADLEARVETLSDRLTHDPRLAAALHEVLSTVTAIRATAAILNEEAELPRDWLDRFHSNIDADARRLATVSRDLVAYLEGEASGARSGGPGQARSPQDIFEAWLVSGAGELPAGGEARALAEHWLSLTQADAQAVPLPGGGAVSGAGPAVVPGTPSHDAHLTGPQLAQQTKPEAVAVPAPMSGTSRGSGVASGTDPQGVKSAAAPDPFRLAQSSGQPLSRVFRRLAALGPDWGLLSADASGALLLRKPPAGFLIPRLGAACPLWPLYLALSRPVQPLTGWIEQAGRLPRRFRYWAIAEPLAGADPGGPVVFQAHMLLTPATSPGERPADPVGTSCRVCPRADCAARREPSVLPG